MHASQVSGKQGDDVTTSAIVDLYYSEEGTGITPAVVFGTSVSKTLTSPRIGFEKVRLGHC